ncbi:multiple epidermal growth factor-like domains protein 6 [Patella vulgata]|uniref:multiple epidermal growth factor-like domains protein 6 n=1 Tax=Patella vulgata TaxID=6465 RepID=UPI0024A81A93|nr:multiple epidermal growth factor-like domains protein 6 [Patella vulgata]
MEGENPCGESCQNTIGSFKCECNKNGYSSSSDGLTCADINECEYNHTTVCDHLCTNLPGSYKCSCHPGYRKHGATKCAPCPKGYYRGVRDKVCKSCPTHATTAEEGAISLVECLCKPGFKGDPSRQLKCKDINECTEEDNYGCSHRCTNAIGSAYCGCKEGFRLDSDHKTCIDVDECKINNGGCQQICYNTPGSFGCDCRTPHYSLARNGKSCRDVNECLNNKHTCSHQCVNIRDGYRCACHTGYGLEYDNKTCSDIDECERDNGRCSDKCVNTLGSYTCECTQTGLTLYGDGKQCVDRNECLEDNPCQDKCENTHGSYRCVCSNGNYNLSADSHTCSDLDECASNFTNACDQVCINLPGSYRCSCHAGYYRAGSACVACRKNTYRDSSMLITSCERCPPRTETEGTAATSLLECKCPKGFERKTPKSQVCTDIDECSKENKNISGCSHSCYNLPGRYFCSCPRGARLQTDRKTCYGSNNCKPLEKPKKGIVWPPACLGVGIKKLTPGVACSFRCHHGYRLTGSRIRTCAANGQFSGSSSTCKVIKCRGLNSITNGRLHPPKCRRKSVPFGKRCRVRCNPGYKLVGRIGTKCRATGKWSHRLRTSCEPETTSV